MKTLTSLLLLISLNLFAQSSVGIAMYQDARLSFGDAKHGNNGFTTDLTAKLKLQGYEKALGHTVYAVKFRYTDLAYFDTYDPTGFLYRYGMEFQYAFNLGTNRFHFAPLVGYGIMRRQNTYAYRSWEFGGEITFRITDWLKLNAEGVYMQRPDLPKVGFRFNGSIGLQFDINTNYLNR